MSSLDNIDLDDPEVWKNSGNDYFHKGQYEEAIKCYFKAIELNPDFIEAWNNLGYTYLKMGRIEEADRCNKKVKEIKANLPNEGESHYSQTTKKNRRISFPLLLILIIAVVAIALVAASMLGIMGGGDTSNTPNPLTTQTQNIPITTQSQALDLQFDSIVGVWVEDLGDIYTFTFTKEGDYFVTTSSFEKPLQGKWTKINEKQYVVSYSFTDETDTYIYNPLEDILTDSKYPEQFIYRVKETPPSTSIPITVPVSSHPQSSNIYKLGDEIQRLPTDSAYDKDRAWVILKVDYDEEKYSIGKLYYDPDVRQWYKVNDDLPEIRFFNAVERDYPILVGSINWNSVPVKYTIKTCDGNTILSYDSKQPECDTGKNAVSGYGDDVIKLDVKTADLLVLSISHSGKSNFAVILKDSNGDWVDLIVNTIGSYNGRKTVKVDVGTYWFDITADGAWTIKFST